MIIKIQFEINFIFFLKEFYDETFFILKLNLKKRKILSTFPREEAKTRKTFSSVNWSVDKKKISILFERKFFIRTPRPIKTNVHFVLVCLSVQNDDDDDDDRWMDG